MKKYLSILGVLSFTLGSCAGISTIRQDQLPPGQAKKVHGEQSAKDFAPGQQQKGKNEKKTKPGTGTT